MKNDLHEKNRLNAKPSFGRSPSREIVPIDRVKPRKPHGGSGQGGCSEKNASGSGRALNSDDVSTVNARSKILTGTSGVAALLRNYPSLFLGLTIGLSLISWIDGLNGGAKLVVIVIAICTLEIITQLLKKTHLVLGAFAGLMAIVWIDGLNPGAVFVVLFASVGLSDFLYHRLVRSRINSQLRRMNIESFGTMSVLLITVFLAGCSNAPSDSMLLLGPGGTGSSDLQSSSKYSVINNNPRVVIAKSKSNPKGRMVSRPDPSSGGGHVFTGAETQSMGGVSQRQSTVMTGGDDNAPPQFGDWFNSGGIFGGSSTGYTEPSTEQQTRTESVGSIVTPVASTAYGESRVVLKSINGGFGILLLKKGNNKNHRVCEAFFNTLPSKQIGEIEFAAQNENGLFRPTYWLDRREDHEIESRPSYQLASADVDFGSFLSNFSPDTLAKLTKTNSEKAYSSPCVEKVANYNYLVSHALIRRLGLFSKRGPFLAAWRDDGGKAMVFDLSLFESKFDFQEALDAWTKMIVRHPGLWEVGAIRNAGFRQKLRNILNKSGQSVLSMLIPTTVEAGGR